MSQNKNLPPGITQDMIDSWYSHKSNKERQIEAWDCQQEELGEDEHDDDINNNEILNNEFKQINTSRKSD